MAAKEVLIVAARFFFCFYVVSIHNIYVISHNSIGADGAKELGMQLAKLTNLSALTLDLR